MIRPAAPNGNGAPERRRRVGAPDPQTGLFLQTRLAVRGMVAPMNRKFAIALLLGAVTVLAGQGLASRLHRPATLSPEQIAQRVHVRSLADVERLRARTLDQMLGDRLPEGIPDGVPAGPMLGADASMKLPNGYWLDGHGDKLAIYHAGHNQVAVRDAQITIRAMLRAGYDVLALDMPAGPHERFAEEQYPLRPFIAPVAEAINFAVVRKPYREIVMTGLSGGGWTTVVYAALDPRIDRSYPVAGSWPFPLRRDEASRGDFEQRLPGLSVGYLDLYLMAASDGRQQVQVFNLDDPCCFAGRGSLSYEEPMANRALALGGSFGVVVVANDTHSVQRSLARLIFPSAPQRLSASRN